MLYKNFINCFKDGNIKTKSYEKGDNDVYFIHFTNTTDANKKQSKDILMDNGFISNKDIEGKMSLYINPSNKKQWTNKYLYSYEKILKSLN
jgi:hypothetical protein